MCTGDMRELLLKLKASCTVADTYLSTVPVDLRSSVFDNAYVAEVEKQVEMLITFIFPDKQVVRDLIYWFLYDSDHHDSFFFIDENDKEEHLIKNIDDLIDILYVLGLD